MTWAQRHPEKWKAYYAKWKAAHPGYDREYWYKRKKKLFEKAREENG